MFCCTDPVNYCLDFLVACHHLCCNKHMGKHENMSQYGTKQWNVFFCLLIGWLLSWFMWFVACIATNMWQKYILCIFQHIFHEKWHFHFASSMCKLAPEHLGEVLLWFFASTELQVSMQCHQLLHIENSNDNHDLNLSEYQGLQFSLL